MEYNQRQKRILKEMEERKPSLFEKASKGDKVARHILSNMGLDTDYLESDMNGPRYTAD